MSEEQQQLVETMSSTNNQCSSSDNVLTTQQQQQYIRRKGEAPVKLEYIIMEKPTTKSTDDSSTTTTTTEINSSGDNSSTVENNDSEKKRKHEGDNKNSKKAKSFHNRTRDAMKKQKKEKNKTTGDGNTAAVEENTHNARPEGESNFVEFETIKQLRKKAYNFEKAEQVTKHVEDYVRKEAQERSKSEEALFRQRQQQIVRQKMIERGEAVPEEASIGLSTYKETKYHPSEIKKVDFTRKTYLAPLTTVGNLPFRRVCKDFGCDITIGEMALSHSILKGERGDISLLRRHESEKIFGVQLAGKDAATMTRVAQLIDEQFPNIDFVDVNCGCPVNTLCSAGMGAGMMEKRTKLVGIVRGMKEILSIPVTVKMRTGSKTGKNFAHKLMTDLCECGVDGLTLHGRSREMRYTKEPDYQYIYDCSKVVQTYSEKANRKVYMVGNGDIYNYQDWYEHIDKVDTLMIGRGALIKPWLFREIEQQHTMDITSSERLEMLKTFVKYGLDHYGSDDIGISKTRRFLLEWLSFLCRYVPVGLLERLPIKLNERPPLYRGRNELETLMASSNGKDWVTLTELAGLPKPGDDFVFIPKHKSNSYEDDDYNG